MRKLAFFSICLYFFTCPLEFALNQVFGSSVKFVAIFSVASIFLYYVSDRNLKLKFGAVQWGILGWVALEAISMLWTTQTERTMGYLETYALTGAYVFLVSLFPFTKKEIDAVALVYAIGTLIALLLLFMVGDYYNGDNYENRITIAIGGRYQDPNGLAAYLCAGLVYFVVKIFDKKWYTLPSIILSLALIYGILQTGSRGALVAIAATVVVVALLLSPKKRRIPIVIGIGITAIIGYFIMMAVLPVELFNRIFNIQNYIGGSGRVSLWVEAINGVLENPIFGSGITSHFTFFNERMDLHFAAMHNTYLCVLFEVGIVGFIAFIIPFVTSLYNSIKKRNIFIFSLLFCNMVIVFFLDSVYLRYIWNALMLGIMYYNYSLDNRGEELEG